MARGNEFLVADSSLNGDRCRFRDGHAENEEKIRVTHQGMSRLRPSIHLAQKMGKILGFRDVLFETVPGSCRQHP